jgi:hypothetical protein
MGLSDSDVERIADAVVRRMEDMANNAEVARFVVQFIKEEDKKRLLELLNDSPKPPELPAEP